MNREVAALWSGTALLLWPQEIVLASFDLADLPAVASALASRLEPPRHAFSAVVVERDEVSLSIERAKWDALAIAGQARAVAGPYRAITLDLQIDLGVSGYLLPAAERLAAAGISIVPQCAFRKDHLLVRADDATRAMSILGALVDEARETIRVMSESARLP
jgi:hypothetical protein